MGESDLAIYPLDEIIEVNEGYEVEEYAAGVLLIGTNLGGEAFALDYRYGKPKYIMIPFIVFEDEAIIVLSDNMEGFLSKNYEGKLFDE